MDFIQGFDRDQLQLLSLDSMVKQSSWARVVDLFVDMLPLTELGFACVTAQQGRPPYSPSDMLKLYLYGYKNAIRSSRKLAHACQVNIEVMWLLKGLRPSSRKIAYFRKDNAKEFKQAFRYFVLLLKYNDLAIVLQKNILLKKMDCITCKYFNIIQQKILIPAQPIKH